MAPPPPPRSSKPPLKHGRSRSVSPPRSTAPLRWGDTPATEVDDMYTDAAPTTRAQSRDSTCRLTGNDDLFTNLTDAEAEKLIEDYASEQAFITTSTNRFFDHAHATLTREPSMSTPPLHTFEDLTDRACRLGKIIGQFTHWLDDIDTLSPPLERGYAQRAFTSFCAGFSTHFTHRHYEEWFREYAADHYVDRSPDPLPSHSQDDSTLTAILTRLERLEQAVLPQPAHVPTSSFTTPPPLDDHALTPQPTRSTRKAKATKSTAAPPSAVINLVTPSPQSTPPGRAPTYADAAKKPPTKPDYITNEDLTANRATPPRLPRGRKVTIKAKDGTTKPITVFAPQDKLQGITENTNRKAMLRRRRVHVLPFNVPADILRITDSLLLLGTLRTLFKADPILATKKATLVRAYWNQAGRLIVHIDGTQPLTPEISTAVTSVISAYTNSDKVTYAPSAEGFVLRVPNVPVVNPMTGLLFTAAELKAEFVDYNHQFVQHPMILPPRFATSTDQLQQLALTRGTAPVILTVADPLTAYQYFFGKTNAARNSTVMFFGARHRLHEPFLRRSWSTCTRCLRDGHVASTCMSAARCDYCAQNHSTETHATKCQPCSDRIDLADQPWCAHILKCACCDGPHCTSDLNCPKRATRPWIVVPQYA